MQIVLDHKKSQQLSEIIHSLSKDNWDPTLYHLTDGVYCPVKAYCRLTGVEGKASRRTAAYWTIGKVGHKILEENFDLKEKEVIFRNAALLEPCYGHIDVLYEKQPINFKTTRKQIRFASDIPAPWVLQNAYECVFTSSLIGWLPVLEIVPAIITVWKLQLTQDELVTYLKDYVDKMRYVQQAVGTRNPYLLMPSRGECRDCIYRINCSRRPGL